MIRIDEVPARLLGRPFRFAEAQRLGVTEQNLRGDRFRRLFHDVYVVSELADSLELHCDGAALLLPAGAAFCGVTAARLYGVPVPERDQTVHVAVPSTRPTVPRIRRLKVHSYTIPAEQVRKHDGRWVVAPERLFLELAATLPRLDLIIAGDHMLRHSLTTREKLADFLGSCHRRRGVLRAREALPLMEERVDSPPETRLRILILDHNMPRPVVNQDVYNAKGVWLARPDLSYPALKIAIEYEGIHHQELRDQYVHDIQRDTALTEDGWEVIRVTKEALFHAPKTVIARIRRSLARRS